jgi:hypothetical protein
MSDRILVSTRKGVFDIQRKSGGWKIEHAWFLGQKSQMCLPARDGSLYVSLPHQHFGEKLHRSTDSGETWAEIGVPVYPKMPEGHVESHKDLRWSLNTIWALESGGPDQKGLLWCGTIPGGLFKSNDDGASWEMVRSLWEHPLRQKWFGGGADFPGIHSVCVDPRNSKHVTVAVSCGGVWSTDDCGATWNLHAKGMRAEYLPPEKAYTEEEQDPHRLVQCPASPDTMWVQHHNGIFRSKDGGRSWSEIEIKDASTFGFGVVVHPKNPDTAWFVPAEKDAMRVPIGGKVTVTRTRDGGKTFDVLRNGLPQEHAYDITFRHALDIDDSGDRLAFGTTTGSLWVSEDQGDRWINISTHLPPIYCVRFAKKT